MNPFEEAVKFLLLNVINTGNLPGTAQAQFFLDEINGQSESIAPPVQMATPEQLKASLNIPGVNIVPDSTVKPISDAHNVAVSKTK